jgi:hypothetical protein
METNSKTHTKFVTKGGKAVVVSDKFLCARPRISSLLLKLPIHNSTIRSDLLLCSTVYVLFLGNALKLLHSERALSLLIHSVAALCKW